MEAHSPAAVQIAVAPDQRFREQLSNEKVQRAISHYFGPLLMHFRNLEAGIVSFSAEKEPGLDIELIFQSEEAAAAANDAVAPTVRQWRRLWVEEEEPEKLEGLRFDQEGNRLQGTIKPGSFGK